MVAAPPASPVTEYAESVTRGALVTNRLVRLAAERHLRDLETGTERGLSFDETAADRAVGFYRLLPHIKGEWAGSGSAGMELAPWQAFIIGSLFGWKRADGTRRFRTAYVEVARKNGKSTLAAGLGLMLAFFDDEPGAEVYAAATKRDQAKIVWGDARQMVLKQPGLRALIRPFTANLHSEATASKFEPLGADADTMDGLNIHGAIVDELHAHPSRAVVDVLETATGARRQPLTFYITTAGYDRHSVCWAHHDYTVKLLEETYQDDTWFGFVAGLDGPRIESLPLLPALRQMDKMCTCRSVPTTRIETLGREVFATLVTSGGVEPPGQSDWTDLLGTIDALTTPIGVRDHEGCAKPATSSGTGRIDQSGVVPTRSGLSPREDSALPVTKYGFGSETRSTESVRIKLSASGPEPTRRNAERLTPATALMQGDGESWIASASVSTGLLPTNMTPSMNDKTGDARSVASGEQLCVWITAISQALFGGYSAHNATQQSAYSEILRKVYSEHSPTCEVRTAELTDGGRLLVSLPGDRWDDPAVWVKANPNLAMSVKRDDLERKCERARQVPAEQQAFRRLHCNEWTESVTRWLDLAAWDRGAEPVDLAALTGRACYGGLDLSSTTDLTGLVLVFPDGAGGYDVLAYPFVPEESLAKRAERDRVPYPVWRDQGHITATDGNVVDYDVVESMVAQLAERYDLRELAIDRWNSTGTQTRLTAAGITVIPFGQGFASMTAPAKELERLVLEGRIRHGGHPVLRWCIGNTVVQQDPAGNIKPAKDKSTERIDLAVALVMALGRAMVHAPAESVYESRGLRFL